MASPPAPAARAGRRIVVAVDGGEESMHALSWCLANVVSAPTAGGAEDTVVLLNAKRPLPVYAAMDSAGIVRVKRFDRTNGLVVNRDRGHESLLVLAASCRVHAPHGRDGERGAPRRRRVGGGR
jgi:hypothetical protein